MVVLLLLGKQRETFPTKVYPTYFIHPYLCKMQIFQKHKLRYKFTQNSEINVPPFNTQFQ